MRKLLISLFLVLSLGACASVPERFISDEMDAQLRAKCENTVCAVITQEELAEIINSVNMRRNGI